MLTDQDVIKFIVEQAEEDFNFMNGSDGMESVNKECTAYEGYMKGQKAGVSRAMAFLRRKGILKKTVIDNHTHCWSF